MNKKCILGIVSNLAIISTAVYASPSDSLQTANGGSIMGTYPLGFNSLEIKETSGSIHLLSLWDETLPLWHDGGILIEGNPVRAVTSNSFEIWSANDWDTAVNPATINPPPPMFSVSPSTGISTFTGTDLYVSKNGATGGNLMVAGLLFAGGKQVLTGSSNGGVSFGTGTASGGNSLAGGTGSSSSASNSFAWGSDAVANSLNSIALGSGSSATTFAAIAVGLNNTIALGNSTTWVASDALFSLGNGESSSSRSNAIETLKNGQTTLINKYWNSSSPTSPVFTSGASNGNALVVKGNTELHGRVIVSERQGDISMGDYAN